MTLMSSTLALQLAMVLTVTLGLTHSLLGEWLIFRHLRDGRLVPTIESPRLRERQLRITWASWHLVTLLGWTLAGLLWQLAELDQPALNDRLLPLIQLGLGSSAVLVLYATRGRHPGWLVLGVITLVLSWA